MFSALTSKLKEIMFNVGRNRMFGLDAAAILFGTASWISINGKDYFLFGTVSWISINGKDYYLLNGLDEFCVSSL